MNKKPVLRAFQEYSDWTAGMYPNILAPIERLNSGMDFLESFTVKEQLKNITVPALALVSDGEVLIRQAEEFPAGIASPNKKIHRFSMRGDGSDDHCQLDNRSRGAQVLSDWLDGIFNIYEGQ